MKLTLSRALSPIPFLAVVGLQTESGVVFHNNMDELENSVWSVQRIVTWPIPVSSKIAPFHARTRPSHWRPNLFQSEGDRAKHFREGGEDERINRNRRSSGTAK